MNADRPMPTGATVKPGRSPRKVIVPAALNEAFAARSRAKAAFDRLSRSHQNEYVNWIADAKRPETLARRLRRLTRMLIEKQPAKARTSARS